MLFFVILYSVETFIKENIMPIMNNGNHFASSDFGSKSERENSVYIWKVLINIIDNNGKTDNLSANYKQQIMSGKLLNTTCQRDNEVGAKLKALVIALDKPENREEFLKSYFCAALIVLRNGAKDVNSLDTWVNYSARPESHMQGKGILNSALISYKDDNHAKLGLDMNAYLNTIIKREPNGNYALTNISAAEGDMLISAVDQTVTIMKESEKFRSNFENKHLDDSENS